MMDWAEDLKFSLKKSAKKGRRANADTSSSTLTSPTSPSAESSSKIEKPDSGGTTSSSSSNNMNLLSDERSRDDIDDYFKSMPRVKRSGVWADDDTKTTKFVANVIEQERFSSITNTTHFSDDDIPVIPDLDDIHDDLFNEIAEAPIVTENRTATYKELNSDLLKQAAFTAMEDIDLSILGRCLQPEVNLIEPDEEWSWDKLFIEVSSDIHAEKPKSADVTATQFVN